MNNDDVFEILLSKAESQLLKQLIRELVKSHKDVKRLCVDFLKRKINLKNDLEKDAQQESIVLLWDEIYDDLVEMDEYGGTDEETEDMIMDVLYEISQKLMNFSPDKELREMLLDDIMPLVESENSGMTDELMEVASSLCHTKEHWRDLAGRLEDIGDDFNRDNARDIYRMIGDDEKYLSLRLPDLISGVDYYELALFYWDKGQKKKAVEVAREGLEKGEGRLTELREFLSQRAKESGNKEEYIELQFAEISEF